MHRRHHYHFHQYKSLSGLYRTLIHPLNQVDTWEDELAANAEEDEHGGVLNQIVKERELATKVANQHSIPGMLT